jgi:hypothetical protein
LVEVSSIHSLGISDKQAASIHVTMTLYAYAHALVPHQTQLSIGEKICCLQEVVEAPSTAEEKGKCGRSASRCDF